MGKVKTMDILECIAALDFKVARCRQLMESMKVCNLLRSRSFLAFALGHFNIKIKIMVYDYHRAYESEILCGFSMLRGNKMLCIKSGWNA